MSKGGRCERDVGHVLTRKILQAVGGKIVLNKRSKKRRNSMLKQIMIGLCTLSLVAILWSEADAACLKWRTLGGSKTCVSWSTGSEVCDATSTGVGNVNDCDETLGTCPTLTCSAFGTVDPGNGSCDPNTIDPDCNLQGVAFCVNKAGNARKAQGQPFTLEAFLSATEDIDACTKNGKCLNTISLNPELSDDICINPNWQFLTFTAQVFNAEVVVCPGGYDTTDQCCDTADRINGGTTCAVPGSEATLAQRCTVNLTNYRPGDKILYDCCDLTALVNGQCPQLP